MIRNNVEIKLCGAILAAVLVLSGCGGSETAAVSGVSAPSDSQKLTIYTAHKEEVYRPVIEEFEDRTGIWVDVEAGGTTEMLRRIQEEQKAGASGSGAADIMFGGGAENLETFRECFESYYSANESALDQNFLSADGSWTPFTELPIVFIYNNKLVSEDDAPKSWREFLDGTWSGKVSFADPEKSGTSITILETLRLVSGEQEWSSGEDELLKDFADGLEGHMAAGSGEVIKEVSSGERMVGITLEETALKEIAKGSDLGMRYPEEGTSAVPDGAAVVQNAPHGENARKFIDFMTDLPVQKYVETNLYRRSVRTDVNEIVRGTAGLDRNVTGDLRVLNFDVKAASEEERQVLERFLEYARGSS